MNNQLLSYSISPEVIGNLLIQALNHLDNVIRDQLTSEPVSQPVPSELLTFKMVKTGFDVPFFGVMTDLFIWLRCDFMTP